MRKLGFKIRFKFFTLRVKSSNKYYVLFEEKLWKIWPLTYMLKQGNLFNAYYMIYPISLWSDLLIVNQTKVYTKSQYLTFN